MNILELLTEHNIPFRRAGEDRHVSQGWLGLNCPFCRSKEYHLGIHIEKTYVNCWKCGSHKLVDILETVLGIDRNEAHGICQLLQQDPGIISVNDRATTSHRLVLPQNIGPLLPIHRQYLRQRGFKPEEISYHWKIQGIGLAAQLSWRLWIPIYFHGQIVSWTTRAITDNTPCRYISAPKDKEAIPAKSLLYGMDHVRHAAIVVEGPVDVWRLGPGAVATLGTSYSRAQVEQIAKIPVRCILFDSEDEAQKRARKLAEMVSGFPGETHLASLSSADPGEAKEEEILELRRRFLE